MMTTVFGDDVLKQILQYVYIRLKFSGYANFNKTNTIKHVQATGEWLDLQGTKSVQG